LSYTILEWIFLEFFQNHFLRNDMHHDYFFDLNDEEKLFVTLEWQKHKFATIPWENKKNLICSIGLKVFFFSISYIFHITDEGNDMISVDQIEFNELSLTRLPRYKKCYAIIVNSK
ncbi:MAG: hypothetical protein AAB262_01160, partial [Elusimicrobiota bacterium]